MPLFVCLIQPRASVDRADPVHNRRPSISASALANKWYSHRRRMSVQFQALHFAIYGPDFHTETCHRTQNLGLIRDAMRAVLDRHEYAEFVEDVEKELDHPDGTDGMR
jgi:hypothetical protein